MIKRTLMSKQKTSAHEMMKGGGGNVMMDLKIASLLGFDTQIQVI